MGAQAVSTYGQEAQPVVDPLLQRDQSLCTVLTDLPINDPVHSPACAVASFSNYFLRSP